MSIDAILSIAVFVSVIALIAAEAAHRTTLALAGAVILLLAGIIPFDKAMDIVDWNTLGVLVGMMIFVAIVKNSGIFQWIAIKTAKLAKGDPWRLMVAFMIITALLSALLDNVTTVLLVGPMTLTICKILKLDPVPFFIAEMMASNIGGTATLIGDPPNIMLGSMAGLSFMDFLKYDAPAAIIVLITTIICFRFIFYKRITNGVEPHDVEKVMKLDEKEAILDKALFNKGIAVGALVVLGFLFHGALGFEPCFVALAAAAIMMIVGKQDVEHAIYEVEWPTIGFFLGLFVIVGGMEVTGVITSIANGVVSLTKGNEVATMIILLWGSAIFSAFLDNIPFVAAVIPVVTAMGAVGMDTTPLWWAISLGACLGGNGSLIGASANVVLSGISAREGYPISFMGYLKIAFPMMIFSIVLCTLYLLIIF